MGTVTATTVNPTTFTFAAMGQVHFLQLLCVIATAFAWANAIKCYNCENDPRYIEQTLYDEDCGNPDYHNGDHVEEDDTPGNTCGITVWRDGYVSRFLFGANWDKDCYCTGDFCNCYCTGDFCNTGNLCEYCYTTTVPESSTPVHSTSSRDPLQCYSCSNCSTVDKSTPVIQDEQYHSCVTKVNLDNNEVIRSASSVLHIHGECMEDQNYYNCWCNENLCNYEAKIVN